MKQKIENAIRETLVIGNKQSIHRAVDKILLIVAQEQALQQCSVSGRSEQVCHICGGENGHTIECTSWCGNTVTV